MNLSQKLSELIATHMSRPGHVSETRSDADFVMSGLRSATFSNMITRRKILSDISVVLNCKSEDLEFLYSDISQPTSAAKNYELMVPDFQRRLLVVSE